MSEIRTNHSTVSRFTALSLPHHPDKHLLEARAVHVSWLPAALSLMLNPNEMLHISKSFKLLRLASRTGQQCMLLENPKFNVGRRIISRYRNRESATCSGDTNFWSYRIPAQVRLHYSAVGSNWLFDVFLGLANSYLYIPSVACMPTRSSKKGRRSLVALVFVCWFVCLIWLGKE